MSTNHWQEHLGSSLFTPKTPMRYFGSKSSGLYRLREIVGARGTSGTFCDCFGGVATVGAYFKTLGFEVHTGDILGFAHLFQIARIGMTSLPSFNGLAGEGLTGADAVACYLDSVTPQDGWFVHEYSAERQFFTMENARRINAIWKEVSRWARARLITVEERAILLASLIESADRVANTAGTYYAYLKHWHRKALNSFEFRWAMPARGPAGVAVRADAKTLLGLRHYDVVYLDPPYNERSYAHYYHLPETLATEGTIEVRGRSGMPQREMPRSDFNNARSASGALEELVTVADCDHLLLHYSDDGIISKATIRQVLAKKGNVHEYAFTVPTYSTEASRRWARHRIYVVE